MGEKILMKLVGCDYLFFLATCESKVFVYLFLLILTAGYCLGKAINTTNYGYRNGDIPSMPKYEAQLYSLNSSNHNDGVYVKDSLGLNSKTSLDTKNNLRHPSKNASLTVNEPRSELPLPILIASPVAAVSIVLLICIAYKWHSIQLDEQAKKLAIERTANQCHSSSPCRTTQRLVPPGRARADSDLSGGRRKSLRTPTPPPNISRSRASLWSADQEVLTHVHASPRRHSTFIL